MNPTSRNNVVFVVIIMYEFIAGRVAICVLPSYSYYLCSSSSRGVYLWCGVVSCCCYPWCLWLL